MSVAVLREDYANGRLSVGQLEQEVAFELGLRGQPMPPPASVDAAARAMVAESGLVWAILDGDSRGRWEALARAALAAVRHTA